MRTSPPRRRFFTKAVQFQGAMAAETLAQNAVRGCQDAVETLPDTVFDPEPAPPAPARRTGPGSRRLSYQDIFLTLQLETSGKSLAQIAKVMGVSADVIERVVSEFRDTRPLARKRLDAAADRLAKTALEASQIAAAAGDGDIALELLDRLDVAPKHRDEKSAGAKVMVIVGNGHADPDALPDFSALSLPSSS